MNNIDWTQLITKEMKQIQNAEKEKELQTIIENEWRESEMILIADQLLRIEDDDPTAKPGTSSQWRAYRVKVRAWVEGNSEFPELEKRPVQPV